MSYSEDFRNQVLSFIDSGSTIVKASELFSIGSTTIKNWRRTKRETGQVMGVGRPKGGYKLDDELLKEYVTIHTDAYLNEIASHFDVQASTVCMALKRLKITRKKSRLHTRKNEL